MRILICQPDSDYFIWQLKTQMYNFAQFGVEQDALILLGYRGKINPNAEIFAKLTKAEVVFIEDTRSRPLVYMPNIVPHLAKKHPPNEPFLYIGDDCLFVKQPVYPTGKKVYLANTASYISSAYIKKRSQLAFYAMADIVGIDPRVIEANDGNCGGAQHLFNVVPEASFWERVERDSESILLLLDKHNEAYLPELEDPKAPKRIQAWTAGMWGLLWNLWLLGIETRTSHELLHSWPSTKIAILNNYNFYHNSGVREDRKNVLFFKGDYRYKAPGDLNFVSKEYCSSWYATQVMAGLDTFVRRAEKS